jgi:hypothetical protein
MKKPPETGGFSFLEWQRPPGVSAKCRMGACLTACACSSRWRTSW